jgi:endonuclease-8
VIGSQDFEAVGFNIPVAEFIKARDLERHEELRQLGPALLADDFDGAEAAKRTRERPSLDIGDALLNQRVMAGIGNVYKSEVLFLCGVNPFRAVATIPDADLQRVIETARTLLHANVSTGLAPMTTYTGYRRTTRRDDPTERLWVYGRARMPCRRCGAPILVKPQGSDARLTYWCPTCQPALAPAGSE